MPSACVPRTSAPRRPGGIVGAPLVLRRFLSCWFDVRAWARCPVCLTVARRECYGAAIVDDHLQGRAFVVGERVSIVDFVMASTLDRAENAGCLEGCTHAAAYLQRMDARPHAGLRIRAALTRIGMD
jgi:hypothetical protein